MLVKIGVGGEDGNNRCGEGLGAIALREQWEKSGLGLIAADEGDAQRLVRAADSALR